MVPQNWIAKAVTAHSLWIDSIWQVEAVIAKAVTAHSVRIDSIPYDKWKPLVIIIVSEKISSFFIWTKVVGNLAFNKKVAQVMCNNPVCL